MKKVLLLLVLAGFASCKSTKINGSTSPGNITADRFIIEELSSASAEDIRKNYADANIKEDIGMFEEGTEELAYSILYPNTPNELHITWANKAKTKINDIRFAEEGEWKSSTGIKVGSSIEELNALNEKPVSFYGFGWDYSGAVMWNNGKLENSNLRIFLAPENPPSDKFYGDHIIKATPEEIAALNLKVKTIIYKL